MTNDFENKTAMSKPAKINSLQTVRAFAFLGIFSAHCGVTKLGRWGVSVFFVLSGFLMFYTYYNRTLDTSINSCIRFSIGKIKKLYLLHILMMMAALVFAVKDLVEAFSVKQAVLCLGEVILNVLLLQTWVPAVQINYSLNGVAWYLSACLFLYACFPIVLTHIKKLDIRKSIMVVASTYIVQIVIGVIVQSINIPITFWEWIIYVCPLFRLGDFIIGCCFGNIFLNKKLSLSRVSATILEILILIVLLCSQHILGKYISIMGFEWFRYTMLYTPTSVGIVFLFALKKGLFSNLLTCKPLLYIGNLSAYTFLIHQIVIRYVNAFSYILIGPLANDIYIIRLIISLIMTFFCAEVYIRIERKIKAKSLKHVVISDNKPNV